MVSDALTTLGDLIIYLVRVVWRQGREGMLAGRILFCDVGCNSIEKALSFATGFRV
jgi:hypothetical protein